MNLTITILSPELVPLGLLNQLTALRWTRRTHTFGDFELWCPLTPENSQLLKPDNLVWIGTKQLGTIEVILKSLNGEGVYNLHISGRFLECYLERRIIWNQVKVTDKISNILRSLVDQNAISPTDSKRVIPLLQLSVDQPILGEDLPVDEWRENLWARLVSIGDSHGLFSEIHFDIENSLLSYTVLQGVDHSLEQSTNSTVILSTDLSDILGDNYTRDSTSWINMAQVAGAEPSEEGDPDQLFAYVNADSTGLDRRETFIDASDISDPTESLLTERGKSQLLNTPLVESFDAKIRMYGSRAYEYGVDYGLGDRITVQDKGMNLQISTEITESEQTWDESGYQVSLTLGTAAPTITELIKRKE